MRVVIDSNVWISALVFGGQPRRVLELCASYGHDIVLSPEIITETRRVVAAKFVDFAIELEALLAVLALRTRMTTLGAVRVGVCRDPDDNRVLETALLGQAGYIISGDRDLLSLGKYEQIGIVSPAAAVQLLSSRD